MAQLKTKIKLYLEANSKTWDKTKVSLQDDGSGPYIKNWTYDIAQPNDSQIASYDSAGDTAETAAYLQRLCLSLPCPRSLRN